VQEFFACVSDGFCASRIEGGRDPGDIAIQIAVGRIVPNGGTALCQAVLFGQKHVLARELLEQ